MERRTGAPHLQTHSRSSLSEPVLRSTTIYSSIRTVWDPRINHDLSRLSGLHFLFQFSFGSSQTLNSATVLAGAVKHHDY